MGFMKPGSRGSGVSRLEHVIYEEVKEQTGVKKTIF